MSTHNPCSKCIGKEGTGEDCCIDVYIILNSDECHLFKNYLGFYDLKEEAGGLFYTKKGCPYLDKKNQCIIHEHKPLYCKFYPIFITGTPYVDNKCPAHESSDYILTPKIEEKIMQLQDQYPIYQKEWLWKEIQHLFEG